MALTESNELKIYLTETEEPEEDDNIFPEEPQGSFAWKRLSLKQTKCLRKIREEVKLERNLANVLKIEKFDTELRNACLLEYYLSNFHWAREQNFDERQISGYMTLCDDLVKNIEEHHFTKLESFAYIKQSLAGVGEDCSNTEVAFPLYFISVKQAKDVFEFLSRTFLLNHALYEHVLTNEQDEMIIGKEMSVEYCSNSLQFPAPLHESVHEHTYNYYINRYQEANENSESEDEEVVPEPKVVDSRSDADKFVDAVMGQISDEPAVQAVEIDELRRMVEKFTTGLLFPQKRALQDKIKQKQAALLEQIENAPSPKHKG